MSPERIADLIRARRTPNSFRAEPAPVELLRQAIELAVWAPNHKLTEPWRFHLIGPETARQIVELNASILAETKGAQAAEDKRKRWSQMPGWFAVSCPRSGDAIRAEEDYAACCCAIQNLALYLWSHGVGIKWSTGDVTRHPEFLRLLDLDPATDRVVGMFWYGYPAQVPHQHRQPLEEVLVEWP